MGELKPRIGHLENPCRLQLCSERNAVCIKRRSLVGPAEGSLAHNDLTVRENRRGVVPLTLEHDFVRRDRRPGVFDNAAGGLEDAKTEQIRKVLAATGGNKSKAAKILGIERKTLYRLIDRFGL